MSNSHGVADMAYELQTTIGDLLPACVVSSTWPTVPVSGLTLAAFSTKAYVRAGQQLTYVEQPAMSVTLTGGDGTYWLAITDDTFSAFAGWTRRDGSHYMWRASATRPSDVDNLLVFQQLAVSGGNITAVATPWGVTAPLARQTSDKVSLGGHAPTGVLDVQGSVQASDVANQYYTARLWPVAPSGAVLIEALRIEPGTGAAIATSGYVAIDIPNTPVTSSITYGVNLNIASGLQRYNVYAAGTAQNYFAGNVGIANATPSYPLDVSGNARITGNLGLAGGTTGGNNSHVNLAITAGVYGIVTYANSAGNRIPISFRNESLTEVGSISTTATATSFNTASDIRLKRNVQPLTDALAVLSQLNPVSFLWHADDSAGVGFLAHELQQHIPEAVSGEPNAVNDDGTIRPQQTDHSKVVPYLVGAIHELLAQVQALTARVAHLEGAV